MRACRRRVDGAEAQRSDLQALRPLVLDEGERGRLPRAVRGEKAGSLVPQRVATRTRARPARRSRAIGCRPRPGAADDRRRTREARSGTRRRLPARREGRHAAARARSATRSASAWGGGSASEQLVQLRRRAGRRGQRRRVSPRPRPAGSRGLDSPGSGPRRRPPAREWSCRLRRRRRGRARPGRSRASRESRLAPRALPDGR